MSIRNIIEGAVSTAEAVRRGVDRGTEGADRRAAAWTAMEKFRATFDPEHVALMEAVVEAVPQSPATDREVDALNVARYDLLAYRKERNL